jgi:hypothetical protein
MGREAPERAQLPSRHASGGADARLCFQDAKPSDLSAWPSLMVPAKTAMESAVRPMFRPRVPRRGTCLNAAGARARVPALATRPRPARITGARSQRFSALRRAATCPSPPVHRARARSDVGERRVEAYAKPLQIQEKMTAEIANTINNVLRPQGAGVIIKAMHHCTTTRACANLTRTQP